MGERINQGERPQERVIINGLMSAFGPNIGPVNITFGSPADKQNSGQSVPNAPIRADFQNGSEQAFVQVDGVRNEPLLDAKSRSFVDISYGSGDMRGRASYELREQNGQRSIDLSTARFPDHPNGMLPPDHPERQFASRVVGPVLDSVPRRVLSNTLGVQPSMRP